MLASADKREETLKKYVFLMVFRYLSEPHTPLGVILRKNALLSRTRAQKAISIKKRKV